MAQAIHQLVGGLKAGMGYTGSAGIAELQRNCAVPPRHRRRPAREPRPRRGDQPRGAELPAGLTRLTPAGRIAAAIELLEAVVSSDSWIRIAIWKLPLPLREGIGGGAVPRGPPTPLPQGERGEWPAAADAVANDSSAPAGSSVRATAAPCRIECGAFCARIGAWAGGWAITQRPA